ncbi:BRCA1-associated protein 2-domain-containing protein [Amylocarpus encephaloides]|uniref:BRCA1-associated protein 2-domain-containing protein n=1 Tax=Amylocarpus encephaloides TaxID=45428 RepID=A0A9P8C261_9HELO|nr:BRCA1-associated protein 2-domain-containing protein [Amylocarpus encephaloides]
MPSYFYHLKFELYPHPQASSKSSQTSAHWLPSSHCDIFSTGQWPSHQYPEILTQPRRPRGRKPSVHLAQGNYGHKAVGGLEEGGTLIDCGVARASNGNNTSVVDGFQESQRATANGTPGFPSPVPQRNFGDIGAARRDWRFGEVRIESFDMGAPHAGDQGRPGHRRGESSTNAPLATNGHSGINAGLAAGGAGRVTKALYESLGGKNTDVGWGIVHLYRDGEGTPSPGELPQGLGHDTIPEEHPHVPPSVAGLRMKDETEGASEDCTTLCIPAVPSYLTPGDFLGFVGEKTRDQVSHFRMVMTGRMNRYLVLMKFRDNWEARRWRTEWDGKVFNSMEPETCHVIFIKSISFQTPDSMPPNTSFPELSHDPFTPSPSASTFLKPFPPPTPSLIELPTCPVCLERMDDITGLLTILCQHVFHCSCLQKWKGSGCPVCRCTNPSLASPSPNSPNTYPQDPTNPPFGSGEAQLCSVCDCADDLWICLICGAVGCGRYKGGHAKEHWKYSAHNFALEIETQHVWDYAGDMWVHRLIRDKGDGKVVELPSCSRVDHYGGGQEREHEDMDLVPREKLERIGIEYTHLLTSQLESQRVYFEELVSKAASKASAASSSATLAATRTEEALARLQILESENNKLKNEIISNLEKDLAREKKKAERSSEIARGFGKSLTEEKKVSEGLMGRIEHVNKSMVEVSRELGAVKGENEELREQNRDLLFSITAGGKLRDMERGGEGGGLLEVGETEGGTVSLPEKKGRGRGREKK